MLNDILAEEKRAKIILAAHREIFIRWDIFSRSFSTPNVYILHQSYK